MPITAVELRALGARPVTLRTRSGDFHGHVAQADIPDTAITVMFASESSPDFPLVIGLEDVTEIVER
ncbi:MAG: hypothetical protein NVS4B5_09780 [Vulcanimicrobiaceae bacterium]